MPSQGLDQDGLRTEDELWEHMLKDEVVSRFAAQIAEGGHGRVVSANSKALLRALTFPDTLSPSPALVRRVALGGLPQRELVDQRVPQRGCVKNYGDAFEQHVGLGAHSRLIRW